jgi:glycosyltransferase involved in cell wall biosynthesis
MENEPKSNFKYSIIIPMWNEEKWVEKTYNLLKTYIIEQKIPAQLIFATDGCTDNTVQIIQQLQKKDSELLLFNHEEKLGRGRALNIAIKNLQTPYIIYMDSDLATKLNHIYDLTSALVDGADVVTGSRLMKDSVCVRSKKRSIFSKVFNILTRLVFKSKLNDHQCGFKAFRRESLLPFLDEIIDKGWFWDTELLLRAQRRGLKVVEFPITWEDRDAEESKVNVWKDAKNMGLKIIKLRWILLPDSLKQLIKFGTVGITNTLITIFTLFLLDVTIGRGEFGYSFAYLIGGINSYIWNKTFTFNQKKFSKSSTIQFIIFFIFAVLGLLIYSNIATLLEKALNFHYVFASIGGTIFNFLIQFMINKYIIFRKEKPLFK